MKAAIRSLVSSLNSDYICRGTVHSKVYILPQKCYKDVTIKLKFHTKFKSSRERSTQTGYFSKSSYTTVQKYSITRKIHAFKSSKSAKHLI